MRKGGDAQSFKRALLSRGKEPLGIQHADGIDSPVEVDLKMFLTFTTI